MSDKRLGPYEILGVLGRGGMGTVFKARHETTAEIVAIKALSHSCVDETHFRQRFESEILALLKLNHPNIVRILSFGQEKGTLFFAMELVEGKSLFHLQREIKKFDWRDVLVIARDVALALRHAHDRGIIHRDLKPGNLLKSESEGIIKVADFGIAKSFGASNDTRDNIVGTLDFMSPEQASGKPVTVRTDLYSLGAVLYTLLSGQPPFAANSIEESLRNLTRVPAAPIREKVANVPEELEMLIAELLEKKPENRTATAYALLRKLDYVEQVLRDYSEAQTAHGIGPKTGPKVVDQEFALGEPENRLAPTDPGDKKGAPNKTNRGSVKTREVQATVEYSDKAKNLAIPEIEDIKISEPVARKDYFSTVTDKHRQKIGDAIDAPSTKSRMGWFPIFLAFAILAAGGIYATYWATLPPSAQALYETIEANASTPTVVHDEIEKFLKLYPKDERASQVRELQNVEKAVTYYKRLAVRVNIPGENRLSNIEQKFVAVMNEVNANAAVGFSQLEAFVTLYDLGANTPLENKPVVESAKAMILKVRNDVKSQINWNRDQITDALRRAESTPAQAPDIYRSIIKMYSDVPYADDLVGQARDGLQRMGL